ncbi:TRAFAC clade GTPase domain-containing protein [Arthrobacter sp. lap29]|uniref:TRAFAC clade GTPase domain-containing protein n=1 Tax=Arthrobacter sp. lap29 TaxID=3056122 RepID=UPI0028F72900|nr:ATP/GTP-binding protein [Arthrobacter sp. lap29]
MQLNRALEQHIAVFGESGSGKTVMISSFYGAAQEPNNLKKNLFHVIADQTGQGNRLHQNYLGMRDSARLPAADKFLATSYSFSIRMKDGANAKIAKGKSFDALRLVWHDYPGEWFQEDVSGPEEAQRRVDTFKSLLSSDVALMMVDGQLLLDNAGEEERYLKLLLGNFKNGLLSMRDDLMSDGKPLVEFPRIWIMALSKSDLLPNLDVYKFRDLLIEKASGELDELREVLAGLVEGNDALSVGEDFVLLSSAEFGIDKIEMTKRVGLDLVLPIASVLPFERHVRWAQAKQLPVKVVQSLLSGAGALAAIWVSRKIKLPGPLGAIFAVVGAELMNDAVKMATEKLTDAHSDALAKKDYLTATLTRFRLDLKQGEDEDVLLRSKK